MIHEQSKIEGCSIAIISEESSCLWVLPVLLRLKLERFQPWLVFIGAHLDAHLDAQRPPSTCLPMNAWLPTFTRPCNRPGLSSQSQLQETIHGLQPIKTRTREPIHPNLPPSRLLHPLSTSSGLPSVPGFFWSSRRSSRDEPRPGPDPDLDPEPTSRPDRPASKQQ